ncbi:S1 family peptidase [Calothrix sp. 336/3]|uniref:S1 family peptidase n=1 Tax=Calothrix sp. 336/3 TaxID=1337936 RepID=UPI0004E2CE7C|nr:serine protease [Calothrix sp. 336/3]AKG24286.1 hypothetical protein IJ00_25855 [Calothrix sp. 336/3]
MSRYIAAIACVFCVSLAACEIISSSSSTVSPSDKAKSTAPLNAQLSSASTEKLSPQAVKKLHQYAQKITVKVMSQDFLGSGIILQKKESVYTVLTNAHVLRAGEAPYRIQTSDGQIWNAHIPKKYPSLKQNFAQGHDLAVLTFHCDRQVYPVATFGKQPQVGESVFVAGFPYIEDSTHKQKLVFNSGKISLLLPKPLEGGYQIGYTNDIQKGMSGGPLLNQQGQVVGVNGMHAYPLWDSPSVFMDGSEAEETLHKKINRLSWAVPIEKVISK